MKKYFIGCLLSLSVVCIAQERYANIDGQKFRIKTGGIGEVTVLFENGMSDSLEVWQSIPDSVAAFAKYFQYDRADIGKSDTSRQARTIPNIVNELKGILKAENINPPYVLVGHSLGGMIMRYFASQYPDEVQGLLLLDPSPESFYNQMSDEELKEYVEGGNEWYRTKFKKQYRKEWYEFISNMKYMDSLNIRKDLPIVLVSATAWEWYKYHKDIVTGFINATHIELEGDHYVFQKYPELMVRYIRELSGQK